MRFLDEVRVNDPGTVSQFPDGTGWTVRGTVEAIVGETLHVRTEAGELLHCGHHYFQVDGEEDDDV